MKPQKILIIDDEKPICDVLSASLTDEGYQVRTASHAEPGLRLMAEWNPDVCFLDIWMPGHMDGIEVLQKAKGLFNKIEFVMISGHGTIQTAVKATKLGAWDFIEKPLSMDKILITLSNVAHYLSEREEKFALLSKLRRSFAMLGESSPAVFLKHQIAQRARESDKSVLFMGEVGAGKHLAAQNLHYLSARASGPWVEVSARNIPPSLVDSELFGAAKGALMVDSKPVKGKVELAQGGSLFIREPFDFSPDAQVKLLNFLRTKKFRPIGADQEQVADVRLLFSTNKTPEQIQQLGSGELARALASSVVDVLPLRKKGEDIALFVRHFADEITRESGEMVKTFSAPSLEKMLNYPWPGNVRELKNFVERIYMLTPGEYVEIYDLEFAGLGASGSGSEFETFREARAAFERKFLEQKIQENQGNVSRTAESIGLERSYLHRKIKAYGIDHRREETKS